MNTEIPQKQNGLGMQIAGGAINSAIGQGMGLIFGGIQDRRQREQQRRLQEIQIQGQKEMGEFNRQQAMRMFEDTGYGAQRDQMERAGLNVGLMYGGSGGGGQTTGGQAGAVTGATAGDPNAGMGMGIQMASQMALMQAQKENIEASTEKIKAETGNTNVSTESNAFDLAVKNAISAGTMADKYNEEYQKIQRENQQGEAEWMTKARVDYEGKQYDDLTSPKAKALSAELEKSVIELRTARTENNIKQAEEVIRNFEASMAKQGLAPSTPWWGKAIADLLTKAGINPISTVAKEIK